MRNEILAAVIATLMATTAAGAAELKGFLYTSLNGEETNQVVSFERFDDGTLGAQKAYSTESLGGANPAAGGDAAGDFDSQGAMQIIGNYMLVVNAGGNTISVFAVDRASGALARTANVGSGGTRPVSIAYVKKASAENQYWVVVGNQWNNPNVQKGGQGEGAIEMYPKAEFHADGGGHEAVLDDRNIHLFSFDGSTGALTAEKSLDTYPGTNGGPATWPLTATAPSLRFRPGASRISAPRSRQNRSRAASMSMTSMKKPAMSAMPVSSRKKESPAASALAGTATPTACSSRISTSRAPSATIA